MNKSIAVVAVLCASMLGACDDAPEPLTPSEHEAITDLELMTPEESIDPNAPEPDDEQPVDHNRPGDIQTGAQSDGPNPGVVLPTLSPGTPCLFNSQCAPGERCDDIPGVTGNKCVGPCTTHADCEVGEKCGSDDFCEVLVNGDWNFCRNGGCFRGQGDCDDDADCEGSFKCMEDIGPAWGLGAGRDVCDHPAGHGSYCSNAHPCGFGQGDCDLDSQCLPGTFCQDNRGGAFGFPSWVDVCLPF